MKQHITKEQWDELSDKQKALFWNKENDSWNKVVLKEELPNIGQMIEFLDDDLEEIANYGIIWHVSIESEPLEPEIFEGKELVDALWEAVKYKLKQ